MMDVIISVGSILAQGVAVCLMLASCVALCAVESCELNE